MDKFDIRVNNAREDLMHMDGDVWENVARLWALVYSLRVIAAVTGLTRSMLQRRLSESNDGREDDVRTQVRNYRVQQAKKLHDAGKNKEEIAFALGLNVKTIESYLRQLRNSGAI